MYQIALVQKNPKSWWFYIFDANVEPAEDKVLHRGHEKTIRKALKEAHKIVPREEVAFIYMERRRTG